MWKKNLATRAICAGNLASFSEVDVISIERTFEQLVPPHNQEGLNILGFFGSMYPAWLGATTCLYVFGEILEPHKLQNHVCITWVTWIRHICDEVYFRLLALLLVYEELVSSMKNCMQQLFPDLHRKTFFVTVRHFSVQN